MTFNRTECHQLRRALYDAIQWNESLIEAHRVELRADLKKYIPTQYKGLVRRWNRQIEQWQKLIDQLQVVK